MDPTVSERLALLEGEVSALRAELRQLREARAAASERPGSGAAAPAQAAIPRAVPPAAKAQPYRSFSLARPGTPPRPPVDLEQLVGRYGTIALTTLTALTAIAVFLRWAIAHGLLGPTARVVVGYAAAGALGFIGTQLRQRGTCEFGNMVLAVGLATVHLVSWGAGPELHVLPVTFALAIAALASVALVDYARRQDEQALAAIGFGGAGVAPFIISSGSHNVVALGLYGAVLVVLAIATLEKREWLVARRAAFMVFGAYVLAMIAGAQAGDAPSPAVAARMPVLLPALVLAGVIALAHATRHRLAALRVASMGAVLGAAVPAITAGRDTTSIYITVLTAAAALYSLHLARPTPSDRIALRVAKVGPLDGYEPIVDAFALPIGFLFATILAPRILGPFRIPFVLNGILAGAWTAAMLYASARMEGEEEAEPYGAAAAVAAIVLARIAIHPLRVETLILLSTVMALVLAAAQSRFPRKGLGFGVIAALALPGLSALETLAARPHYQYLPFLTAPSLSAGVVVAAWIAALLLMSRAESTRWSARAATLLAARVGLGAMAFLAVRAELAFAWNHTAATSLLILYYVITGFVAIHYGRVHRLRLLRAGGLALTVIAAGKVLVAAWDIDNVVVRVGLLIAVSGFMLVVAYWYRRDGPDDAAPVSAPAPATS